MRDRCVPFLPAPAGRQIGTATVLKKLINLSAFRIGWAMP
jgi:hypothetical protein